MVLSNYGENNHIAKEIFSLMTALEIHKPKINGITIKNQKTETTMELSLDIPICLSSVPCLRFEATQVVNKKGNSLFYGSMGDLMVLVVPLQSSKIEFDLDTYIKVMNKEGAKTQTVLWVPLWNVKRRVRVDSFGTKPFSYRSETIPTYDFGSVVEQPKGNCATVKAPFIFAVLSPTLEELC